jgi:hypothetical protein
MVINGKISVPYPSYSTVISPVNDPYEVSNGEYPSVNALNESEKESPYSIGNKR